MRGVLVLLSRPRRVLAAVASMLGASLYVWFAAVRAVPAVKRRKAAVRAARTRRWSG